MNFRKQERQAAEWRRAEHARLLALGYREVMPDCYEVNMGDTYKYLSENDSAQLAQPAQPAQSEAQSVVKSWVAALPWKMQAVLLSALRGCDGIPKDDVSKKITRAFRSELLHAAGKSIPYGSFAYRASDDELNEAIDKFSNHLDHYPNHFVTHLMHAIEIAGYMHPDPAVSTFWRMAYKKIVAGLHLNVESRDELVHRLRGDNGPQIA